jgi:cell wall-associated NlpC family hydrolase
MPTASRAYRSVEIADSRSPVTPERGDVVMRALAMSELPYKYGGDDPRRGFDCSAFVRWVYRESAGFELPRTAAEQARAASIVASTQLLPGDLVFFNTGAREYSHVGIYLGRGRFVHAPSAGARIRIDKINQPYWMSRFDGARRVRGLDRSPA